MSSSGCWDLYTEAKEMKELNQKKVEALQEKWAASIMMHNEEYIGARQKLLSAQLLYPELDKISLMLTICDILLFTSSVKLSNNKIDFYFILDLIYPTATHSDARHYLHNLVTSINGVKDEFPGAELAIEIVENELNMLSDRGEHLYHGVSHANSLISSNEISVSTSKRCRYIQNPDVPVEQRILEEFNQGDQECLNQEFYNFEEERNINLFERGQVWAVRYQSDEVKQCHRYAKINSIRGDVLSITWLKPVPVGADERAWCNAGFPVACGAFHLDLNKCDQVRAGVFSYRCAWAKLDDHIEIYPKRAEIWALYMEEVAVNEWVWNPEAFKGCKFQLVEMLSDYSKCTGGNFVCLVKVNGFHSVFKRLTCGNSPVLSHLSPNSLLFSHKIPGYRLLGGKDEVLFELDQMVLPKNLIQHIGDKNLIKDSNISESPLCAGKFQSEGKFLTYKISTDDFAAGQVWAIYCGKDIMPRQYAVVNNVVSNRQVCVTILEPEVHEVENKWREDLPVACGTFKHNNSNIMLDMSQFSHLVKYVQGTTRSHYLIYPQKGEIWATYKNWNRNWLRADYEMCQFWMVEVISDFSKKDRIKVVKIEEVQDCLTFFHRPKRHEGFDPSCTIFETEMLSFSHQVLAYKVPGVERYGIPDDSWHVEPDAIPHRQKV